jgi:hypothetical protein
MHFRNEDQSSARWARESVEAAVRIMILPAVSDPDVDRRSPQYMRGIMHEKVMKTLGSNEVNALTQFCLEFSLLCVCVLNKAWRGPSPYCEKKHTKTHKFTKPPLCPPCEEPLIADSYISRATISNAIPSHCFWLKTPSTGT